MNAPYLKSSIKQVMLKYIEYSNLNNIPNLSKQTRIILKIFGNYVALVFDSKSTSTERQEVYSIYIDFFKSVLKSCSHWINSFVVSSSLVKSIVSALSSSTSIILEFKPNQPLNYWSLLSSCFEWLSISDSNLRGMFLDLIFLFLSKSRKFSWIVPKEITDNIKSICNGTTETLLDNIEKSKLFDWDKNERVLPFKSNLIDNLKHSIAKDTPVPSIDKPVNLGGSGSVIQIIQEIDTPKQKRTTQLFQLPNVSMNAIQVKMANANEPFKPKALGDISHLHKQILLWEFPPVNSTIPLYFNQDSLKSIPKLFKNSREYAAVFEPLLVLECWGQFNQAVNEVQKSDSIKIKLEQVLAVDGFYDLTFSSDFRQAKLKSFSDLDLVSLCELKIGQNSEIGHDPITAKLSSVFNRNGTVSIVARIYPIKRPDIIPRLRVSSEWSMLKLISLITVHREYTAVYSTYLDA